MNQIDELIEEKNELEKKIKSLSVHNEKLKNECTLLISKNSDINKALLKEIDNLKKKNEIYEEKLNATNFISQKEEEKTNKFDWSFDPNSTENLKKEISFKNLKWFLLN